LASPALALSPLFPLSSLPFALLLFPPQATSTCRISLPHAKCPKRIPPHQLSRRENIQCERSKTIRTVLHATIPHGKFFCSSYNHPWRDTLTKHTINPHKARMRATLPTQQPTPTARSRNSPPHWRQITSYSPRPSVPAPGQQHNTHVPRPASFLPTLPQPKIKLRFCSSLSRSLSASHFRVPRFPGVHTT